MNMYTATIHIVTPSKVCVGRAMAHSPKRAKQIAVERAWDELTALGGCPSIGIQWFWMYRNGNHVANYEYWGS